MHVGSQMLALVKTMYKTVRYYKNGLSGAQPPQETSHPHWLHAEQSILIITNCFIHGFN
jgi:hypothetical protein